MNPEILRHQLNKLIYQGEKDQTRENFVTLPRDRSKKSSVCRRHI